MARHDRNTRTADEYAVMLGPLLALEGLSFADLDAAIIATVVPAALFDLRQFCRKYLKCEPLMVKDPDLDLGIGINVDRPAAVGADRLVNAIAAHARYQGALIVVDFGTATTFDVVSATGDYEGGVIAPGANLSAEALHQAAAMLPRVAIQRTQTVIGKDTVPAMQSGLFWGYLGLIEDHRGAHQGGIWQAHDGDRHRRPGQSVLQADAGDRASRSRPHHPRPDADPCAQRQSLMARKNPTSWSSCRWAARARSG